MEEIAEILRFTELVKDPGFVGPVEWAKLGSAQVNFWGVVAFVVLFATNLIIGHIIIPSFVATGHIAAAWSRARPLLYAGAALSLVVAIFFLSRVVDATVTALKSIWPNFWI